MPEQAIFLSYASQDLEVARRICEALRSAGFEVWFDQSELRGGDAWDASIRHQIKECALFVAIISANTNARSEGYFRLEWKLAVNRSHLMADDQAFLLPVVIDGISESSARVPDRFRERQWLNLAPSEPPTTLVARVSQLLPDYSAQSSPDLALGEHRTVAPTLTASHALHGVGWPQVLKALAIRKRPWAWGATAAAILLASAIGFWIHHQTSSVPAGATEAQTPSNPLSLAILPLRNATGDPKLAYIAEGLTDSLSSDITGNLALTEDAFVTPPGVTASYVSAADPVKALVKELGVHFVLRGNVQRAGSKVRVSAELIDALKRTTVWSETYDGDQSDLLAIQDKVRKNEVFDTQMYVVAAHDIEARGGKQTAVDYYVRGFALEFVDAGVASKRQELDLFRHMLALEPSNPKALICVASALTDLAGASYRQGLDSNAIEQEFQEGRELALKARAMGSKHPWVYEVPAVYARYHDDQPGWLENSKAWQHASPNDLVPLLYIANASIYGGEFQNALPLVEQAIDMDHTPPEWGELLLLGKIYFLLNEDARAIQTLQQARAVTPSSGTVYAYLAMAASSHGDEAAAHAAVEELRNYQPQFNLKAFSRSEKPMPTSSPVYKRWWETRLLPAWRHAGLPE